MLGSLVADDQLRLEVTDRSSGALKETLRHFSWDDDVFDELQAAVGA